MHITHKWRELILDSHSTDTVMRRVQWCTQTWRHSNAHVLSRRVPTEDIAMASRNAPEDGAAAAIRRARLAGV